MGSRFLRSLIPALALAALPAISPAGIFLGVSVNIAPPPLPVYVQPPCPQPGYIWMPGYWAWDDGAYYWVPGTWVLPPEVGLLWTPGYWGWDDGAYIWHAGYWGRHVGFYGGVDYGFGYDGVGFDGGYWHGGVFFYNRAVMRVGSRFVTDVYYHPVGYHRAHEHASFNGGPGGVVARPTREEIVAEHEHHVAFTPVQERHQRMAFADRALRADYNHGRPPVAATATPAVFHGRGAFAARAAGGPVHRYAPAYRSAPLRSDRPSWASGQTRGETRGQSFDQSRGQNRAGRFMERGPIERGAPMREQRFARPQEQRFAPPQPNFQERGPRPMQRPEWRVPAARGPAPPQQRGGGERGHRPPENRGGGRGR